MTKRRKILFCELRRKAVACQERKEEDMARWRILPSADKRRNRTEGSDNHAWARTEEEKKRQRRKRRRRGGGEKKKKDLLPCKTTARWRTLTRACCTIAWKACHSILCFILVTNLQTMRSSLWTVCNLFNHQKNERHFFLWIIFATILLTEFVRPLVWSCSTAGRMVAMCFSSCVMR